MADYIDRAEAIKAVCRKCTACSVLTDKDDKAFSKAHCAEIRALQELPAADVKPVVHGRWIEYPDCLKYPNAYADDHIVCSVCEECFSVLDNDTERFWFCPHCGSDMREG